MRDSPCPYCERGTFRRAPWLYTLACDGCGTGIYCKDERRICCVVPFCGRSRGDRKGNPLKTGMEWICGHHWTLVPARLKRRHTKLRRMLKTIAPDRFDRLARAGNATWDACKKAAIEAATGIR